MPNASFASFLYIFSSFLGFAVFLALAAFSVFQGGGKRIALLFAGICLLGALLNADVALVYMLPDERVALTIDRTIHFFFVFSIPIYIRFVHEFLQIRNARWVENAAWILTAFFLLVIPTRFYISGFHNYSFGRIARAGPLFYVFAAVTLFTVSYCLAALFRAMRDSSDNAERNRIKYIFGGLGFSTILLSFTMLPVMGIPFYPLGNFSFIPAFFLAFGVLRYDLLDMGTLIRKGAAYVILTGVFTGLYIAFISLFNAFFIHAFGSHSLIFSIIMALVIVLLFNPLRDFIQRLIDGIFFRGRYDYHALLKKISGQLASLLKLDQIRELLVYEIKNAMQVERVVLILKNDGGYHLFGSEEEKFSTENLSQGIEILNGILHDRQSAMSRGAVAGKISDEKDQAEIERLFKTLKVTLAVPLPVRERVSGMILLGQKKSGELFVDEDTEILTTIANQAGTAIENAESYEELERLNRNLENIVQDRTKNLKKALSDMEMAQEQLIRSESLAAVGQLVAGAAHELNNPIAGAMSLVETSVETISDWKGLIAGKDEVLEDLQFSIRELRRSAAIIRSLLDLSRQTQTYVEPVDMNRVIDDALRILYNQYKHIPVVIEKQYGKDIPAVEGNFANLGQVMINIIQNAIQALPGGAGKVMLATWRRQEKDSVVVECADDGVGMPVAILNDIFKPFFTTKEVGKGTGLGLYISHEIIRRHGGRIDVESKEGEGTSMKIEIPCKRRDA